MRRPLLTALGDWDKARAQYEQALKLPQLAADQQAAVQLNLARSYLFLADVIRMLGRPGDAAQQFPSGEQAAQREAQRCAQQAAAQKVPEEQAHVLRAATAELAAHGSFRDRNFTACRDHALQARDRYLQAGSLAGLESAHRLLGLTHRRLADAPARSADRQAAVKHFQIAHQLAEFMRERLPLDRLGLSRAGFSARRAYLHEQLLELLIADGRDAEALACLELAKARSLQDLLSSRRIRTARSISEGRGLKELLADWPSDVAALEYYLGAEHAWVFVVDTAGKVQAHRLQDRKGEPIASRALVGRVQRFLAGVNGLGPRMGPRLLAGKAVYDHQWQDDLHELYQQLIPPAALERLRKAKTVVIAPHHILHYFPHAALVPEPDPARDPAKMVRPRFLVEEPFQLIQVPSLTTWDLLRRRPARPINQVQAFGIVDFQNKAPRLEGVGQELQNLKKVFGKRVATVRFGSEATEANARALLGQPGMLAFATHGQNVADHPLDSNLLCHADDQNDGRLTAAEIFATEVRCDLVVLNACYGGLADRSPLPGDDLFGLQRAFLQAGARTVLSGLWDVYDGTAPDLMLDFCKGLDKRLPAAEALAEAQRAHLKTYRGFAEPLAFLTHPYYWAVFAVAGDDRTHFAPRD